MTETTPGSDSEPAPAVPSNQAEPVGEKTFVEEAQGLDDGVDRGTVAMEDTDDDPKTTIAKVQIPEIQGVKLEKELGRGGMGVVYRGRQEFLDRNVAVKMLLDQRRNDEYIARFKREAKILAGLQHPNIVTCYQADITPDGVCFLVMEFVDGPNLRQCIEKDGTLDEADALRVCCDLASALDRAYEKKIIHRDVKSENVLLARAANIPETEKFRYRAKLTDLGLARPETKDGVSSKSLYLTIENAVLGTPLTMSPEQFDDPTGVDHRTDIYGLGCVLYDMLVGQPVFMEKTLSTLLAAKRKAVRGPDPRLRRPTLSAPIAELAMRMVAADPIDRPQTYAEVIATCEALLPKKVVKKSKAERTRVFAAVGLVLVLGGVGLWYATREKTPPDTTQHGSSHDLLSTATEEFRLNIAPVPDVHEGQPVKLVLASVLPKGAALSNVTWVPDKKNELSVAVIPDGNNCSFIAPFAKKSYTLSFIVRADAGTLSAQSESVTIAVDASDDPPALTIDTPSGREREKVTVTATVKDLDDHGLKKYAW